MKLGSSRGMDTKRPRGSERSKPRHELQLTRRSQPPYPWPPEQAQPGVSKPCRTTRFIEERFGAVYSDKAGHPSLPTRLMSGLSILKHMHNLSDEDLCARWIENPYYQLFCGEEFFQHQLTFDRSSLTRWRQRMGEERLVALIQESLSVATRTGAAKPADFSKVIVDTTVQPKAVAFPTDAKLMHRARERLVKLAKTSGRSEEHTS